jgi:hypothetical protein
MSLEGETVVIKSDNKLSSIISFILVILVVLAIIAGYYVYKTLSEENTQLKNEVTQFKKLTESLVRSSTKWATKDDLKNDLKDFLTKEDLSALESDIKEIGSRLAAVGRTVGVIGRKVSKLEASDSEGPENPNPETCDDGRLVDTHGYTKKPQIKLLTDTNLAPLAKIQFNAAKKKPWSYEVYQRQYKLITAVSKKESGQLVFHHNLEYSVPNESEKTYKVNLVESKYKQVPSSSKMFWLNPKLDVNFIVGGNVYGFASGPGRPDNILSMGLDLGLSLSSYGETKADSWFRLFRFSLGYDIERRAGHFGLAPIAFNLGKPLPLLTNLYLSPQIGLDTAGGLTVGMGTGVQF